MTGNETMPTTRFRRARHADIEAIVALVESAYRGDASRKGWTTEADFLDGQRTDVRGVTDFVGAGAGRVVLGERDGVLVACFNLERRGEAAYFGMFSVRPELQGAGLGRAMLAEAERIARDEWHAREMQMSVISIRDTLIGWYERRGYRRTGQYSPFPYGDARYGIPRRDDLRFELMVKPL